ncbi:MAG: four helix bundle protein [Prevotella sp.]|nr:four helix bundle protein [Prevotella sp.]
MDSQVKKARNFREYKVWQDAVSFATAVYEITSQMPWFEKKGLCDQLQRAVVSISSNIAEGAGRSSDIDFARFLDQSLGSANEVETQLLISKNLNYMTIDRYEMLISSLAEIQKQLMGLIASIRGQSSR